MKKIGLLILTVFLLARFSYGATLHHIRFGYYPEKIRAVFNLDTEITYQTQESQNKIEIFLNDTQAGPEIPNYVELNDLIVRYFEIERAGAGLKVTIPLLEPVDYSIFYLNLPPRLVIDFSREYINVVHGGLISEGVEYFKIKKGTKNGLILANVIKVDIQKAEVEPALARKYKPSPLQSFVNLIFPWTRKKSESEHFFLDKVSNIVEEQAALAGINGTFFAYSGSPLGALIIDSELISSPIYDRSAFFIDENHRPFIDNVFISSFFELKKQMRYKVTGINQKRRQNDAILYTPVWGKSTGTNQEGLELVIRGSKISEINAGSSKIPVDGYVLSVNGPAAQILEKNAKLGEKIETSIKIIPYTTSPGKILHLISGGPRLLKNGKIYVSKHEENFRSDIARGRAARTAVGISQAGELLLVTVDGPPKKKEKSYTSGKSIGVTLEELSSLMLSLGALEAVNLDGGSSSTMVIEGRVVNKPTSGYQRRVSNAIVVRPKI